MSQPSIAFDRYYDFAELSQHLQALAKAYPQLATLRSVGKSFQGRDVWLMEITNAATGVGDTKPAYYIEAQIHAEEHATSAVALYAINYLLTQYGQDPEVTRLVDQQAFYIFPRFNPDGAELALQPPYFPWCGNGRFMPGYERHEGLIPEDVDGDGFITSMRVLDLKANGRRAPRTRA